MMKRQKANDNNIENIWLKEQMKIEREILKHTQTLVKSKFDLNKTVIWDLHFYAEI